MKEKIAKTSNIRLTGYKRSKNAYGIRNYIIAVSTVSCANTFTLQIAAELKGVISITHQHGCNHMGDDKVQMIRTLSGICSNPNVGGVLLVGLGCETVKIDEIYKKISKENKIVRKISLQETGSPKEILKKGKKLLEEIKSEVETIRSQEFDISSLIVGLECGGSDPFSGISANPAVGLVSDRLVSLGSTVILSEIPEMIGAEVALSKRGENKKIKATLISKIKRYRRFAKIGGPDLTETNPTPGNIKSGITTIEEKALGCIVKSGNSKIREILDYAQRPIKKGLVIMDTPGNDPESLTGMVAGGAQLILFTTGLGTPVGHPIAPVIKISSNSRVFRHMKGLIDINAGGILEGGSISEVAEEIFDFLVKVGNGSNTATERWGCREFAINRIGPTF